MKTLIQFAYTQASPYKTEKSIYNIIIGKKSHQTFFDAVSLQLFSLYGVNKELSWHTFKNYIDEINIQHDTIPTSNEVTYETLTQTFECLQLLIQTLSNMNHHHSQFMPTSSNVHIHQHVKNLYFHIKNQCLDHVVKDEVYDLFGQLESKHPHMMIHYFLTGYEESMYTPHQVSLIEGIESDMLSTYIYYDLFYIHALLQDTIRFPILSQCCASLNVSKAVNRTYLDLNEGYTIDKIAQMNNISLNTVYDHIVDLFINNYLTDVSQFITNSEARQDFIHYYLAHPKQRLKYYKNAFEMFSYFELKLLIIYISKGAHHAD